MRCFTLLSAILGIGSAAVLRPRQTEACNNSPDLCSKSYSAITHLGAHNSPFIRDASTDYSTSGNHYFNTTVQLNAGVRMLTGQVHKSNGQWRLCHSSCDLLDAGELSDWLGEIKEWMDQNPSDVVSILLVNADNAKPNDLALQFEKAKIVDMAYRPDTPTQAQVTWPTLQTLIDANTRLMAFVGSLDLNAIDDSNSYLMDEYTFIFENAFENISPTNFSCSPSRPNNLRGQSEAAISSNRMPLQNHFLYDVKLFGIEAPAESAINNTNAPSEKVGNMGDAARTCQTEWGKAPVFILVDFFDRGPAIDTVDALNGVTDPVGRKAPPTQAQSEADASSNKGLPQGLIDLVQQYKNGGKISIGAWIWAGADWSKTFGGLGT